MATSSIRGGASPPCRVSLKRDLDNNLVITLPKKLTRVSESLGDINDHHTHKHVLPSGVACNILSANAEILRQIYHFHNNMEMFSLSQFMLAVSNNISLLCDYVMTTADGGDAHTHIESVRKSLLDRTREGIAMPCECGISFSNAPCDDQILSRTPNHCIRHAAPWHWPGDNEMAVDYTGCNFTVHDDVCHDGISSVPPPSGRVSHAHSGGVDMNGEAFECVLCGTTETSTWRRGPDNKRCCNRCGIKWARSIGKHKMPTHSR